MHLLLSLSLTSPAEACSMAFIGDPIGSPRSGAVTPGFAVRPEGRSLNLHVEGPDGEEVAFEQDDLGQYLLPEDLAPGSYTLFEGWGEGPGLEVQVSERPPEYWLVPDREPTLSEVQWEQAWVSEWLTASCMEIRRRRHTLETLSFQIPAAEQNGWAMRIEDLSTEQVFWVGLDEEARSVDFTQDLGRGRSARSERCIQSGLYNPVGELNFQSEVICEAREAPQGCSSSRSAPALLGGLLGVLGLLGLRRVTGRRPSA